MTKNQNDQKKHLSKIKTHNIIYPILIGLGVVGYMVYNEFQPELLNYIVFSLKSIFWLFIAFMFMLGRDIGYMIRLKILSEGKISWYETFRIIMLWEFTSAITPSAIGGTSFAIIYVHKAGLSVGQSSVIVLLTSFFDELYFIIMFPLLLSLIGYDTLFNIGLSNTLTTGFVGIALIGYTLKFLYTIFISYGLFLKPKGFKWILIKVFKLRFLKKWLPAAIKTGDDIIAGSKEIKQKKPVFWIKILGATFLSWSSRYLVVNAIILAFFTQTDHILLFGRQLVMWIMMLVMPTPGGSGFSEYLFKEYLAEFIPVEAGFQLGVAALLALIWRLVTYYPYLIVGVFVFPRWLKSKFSKKE